MWKLLFLAVGLNIIVYATSCTEGYNCNANYDDGEVSATNECNGNVFRQAISILNFTFKFLKKLVDTSKDDEVILSSPLQTWFLTCQIALYSYGNQLKQLLAFLNTDSKEELRCAMLVINSFGENLPKGVVYDFSSNLVANETNMFTDSFKKNITKYDMGRALNYNTMNPCVASRIINRYVAIDTKDRITECIAYDSDIIYTLNNIVFVTGVYFLSDFFISFDLTSIRLRYFFATPTETFLVPFLYQENIYNYTYSSELKAELLAIPFRDTRFTSIIIKPDKRCDSIKSLIQKLADRPDLFVKASYNFSPHFVKLSVPVYKNGTRDVNDAEILKKIGETNSLFSKQASETKNIFVNNNPVAVSGGQLKTIVKFVLTGKNPPNINECSQQARKLKTIEFNADIPVLIIIFLRNIPLFCLTPDVIKTS